MTIYDFEGNVPEIHKSVFVAEDANIIGKQSESGTKPV